MKCATCQKVEASDAGCNCDECYYKATGIDRKTGKVNFRYSDDFQNPYSGKPKIKVEKPKRKRRQMTTSTEYGKMMDQAKEANPLVDVGCEDCSDLSISNNNSSGHGRNCVCMQCAKKKQVRS